MLFDARATAAGTATAAPGPAVMVVATEALLLPRVSEAAAGIPPMPEEAEYDGPPTATPLSALQLGVTSPNIGNPHTTVERREMDGGSLS